MSYPSSSKLVAKECRKDRPFKLRTLRASHHGHRTQAKNTENNGCQDQSDDPVGYDQDHDRDNQEADDFVLRGFHHLRQA
jgi:hypothetical protein